MLTGKERIIQISYENKLSHIGSCLTALPIIEEIYAIKRPDEKFVLSSGHAHLAHAVVMAQESGKDPMEYMQAGIHCDIKNGCDISTGSLGQGLPIALGLALGDRQKDVYVLLSDGETREGTTYESLRVARDLKVTNLKVYINCNGFGAYHEIDTDQLEKELSATGFPINFRYTGWILKGLPEYLQGLKAHYGTLNEETYRETVECLKTGESKRN